MRPLLQSIAFMLVAVWLVVSVCGSYIRADTSWGQESGCGKDYYADYIVFTKLFCEVPHVSR